MNDGTDSPQPPDEGPPTDSLAAYRAKRSSDTSPEPVGRVSNVLGRLFVVHKHAARQLHYDLRLEMDGVLRSWAVPRGPSYDMDDKRLAVKVEDLFLILLTIRQVCVASAEMRMVREDYHLIHVVVKCLGHAVECAHIAIQCRNHIDVGLLLEV